MEFKGTKTKWEISTDAYKNRFGDYYVKIDLIEDFQWVEVHGAKYRNNLEMNANALLISKAPELLEMLKRCASKLEEHYAEYSTFIDEVEELIEQSTTIN